MLKIWLILLLVLKKYDKYNLALVFYYIGIAGTTVTTI